MQTPPQDRHQKGPLAALLILLSLFLGSGTASANADAHAGAAAHSALGRSGAASALLPASSRSTLDDEAPATGNGPALAPTPPSVLTSLAWSRALGATSAPAAATRAQPVAFSYRARAPPAA